MVKAIILDVDGVVVGEKVGFNSPNPHPDVLASMREVREKGIPIILCSAKPLWSLRDIIQGANLNNPHITNAGAMLIDPIDNTIIAKHVIKKPLVTEVIKICLEHKIYVECYTTNEYFISESQKSDITDKHFLVLQRNPKIAQDLLYEISHQDIIRIMPIALDSEDKKRIDALLQPFSKNLSISWGLHPVAAPLQFGILTAFGSSKKEGAEVIMERLGIPFDEVLGVGDTTGDWSFMQLCGYAATLENGSQELKNLIASKGEGHYYIGKSVDENGILDVFNNMLK